jgi:hypothetical protein
MKFLSKSWGEISGYNSPNSFTSWHAKVKGMTYKFLENWKDAERALLHFR